MSLRVSLRKLFLVAALAVGVSSACAAAEEPAGVAHVYKQADGQELKLYVVNPPGWKATDKRPAIVLFHGGGFINGGPGAFADHCEYLASRGMVAISAQYRLLDKDRKKAPLVCNYDAKSAMRWVISHASELGIDLDRLAAGGGSAGGHLAAFIGLVPGGDDPADDLKIPVHADALVLFNPAIAWSDYREGNEAKSGMFREGGDEFLKYAPAKFVTKDSPPTLILSGEKDNVVPMAFLKKIQAQMQAAGARCDAVFYPGQGHAFFHRSKAGGKYYYETLLEVDKFLGSLGWLQGPPTLQPDSPAA